MNVDKFLNQTCGTELLRRELIEKFTACNHHPFYLLVEKLPDGDWRLHGMSFNPKTIQWVLLRTCDQCYVHKLDRKFAVLTVTVDRNDSADLLFCNDWFLY